MLATGSELAAEFSEIPGMELVRLPSVTKLADGTYIASDPACSIEETINRRSSVLNRSVSQFRPDIFIADKEPLGLHGELEPTLTALDSQVTKILGLRDILDDREILRAEWNNRGVSGRIGDLYDEIWIYGPQWFHEPLEGLNLPEKVQHKCRYLGFLGSGRKAVESGPSGMGDLHILVTAGGGEDGAGLMERVLAVCESGVKLERKLVLLLGPLIDVADRERICSRAARFHNVEVVDFESDPTQLLEDAAAVVAMCGYNTFCEILEAKKPVLFVPREAPRKEQLIRATRAAELNAAELMRFEEAADTAEFANRINGLIYRPSHSWSREFVFDGLDKLGARVSELVAQRNLAAAQ
ncbi:MAG: glycosyltransferase family protein [Rhizobiaceae bacterium]